MQRLAPGPLETRGLVAHYQPREDLLGYTINPLLVRGQVHGGIVQGIGQALWEGMVYSPDGQPLTGSLLDYALPVAAELPEMITATIETPSPMNLLGIKGVGELPKWPPLPPWPMRCWTRCRASACGTSTRP